MKRIDPLDFIKNLNEEDLKAAKLQIKHDLIQEFPEDFKANDYKISLGKSLTFLFNAHKRFVNIDK